MESFIDFLKENYYWLILGILILIGHGVQKWNFSRTSQSRERFDGEFSVIFSPVDPIEVNGPLDQQFGFF